jgi:glyoxylase-like metal-dependent hydrolase (beta-lactamase superfamily II)
VPNRRDFLRTLIAAPAGASLLLSQTPAPAPIKATKLSDRLAVLMGDGGNVGVVISDDGLMMVDGGLADRSAELLQAVSTQVDSHRFGMVFNTHWHLDHVGCNETLGKNGAKIIAHANSKKWLSQRVNMEALNRIVEPLDPEGLPGQTFTKAGKLTFGKETIEYGVVPPAHTDGDAYLFFPAPNVLHTGDLLFNGTYPFIDYSTGGWIDGMASAADALLKVGDAKTRIIPGHGPMGTKDDLKASRDMLAAIHERFETLRKQGKTAQEAAAEAPTKDFDARFNKGAKPDQFIQIAYTGLLRHYAPG